LIGIFWAINYVCILVAGSYLPNAIQTIFGQAQLIIVYCVNFLIFHNDLKWYQHGIIGSIITFNLATAWGGGFQSSESGFFLFLWCVIFIVNALAAGLANNLLEALFVVARVDIKNPKNLIGEYTIQDYILGINAVAGIYSLIFCVPLIVIPALAYQKDFVTMVFLDWSSFTSTDGQLFIFAMGVTSWLFTIVSYFIIAETTALWMTVASQIGTIVQIIFLAYIPSTLYQSKPDLSGWINNAILCSISVLYAYGQPNKEETVQFIADSFIGKYYKKGLEISFSEGGERQRLLGEA